MNRIEAQKALMKGMKVTVYFMHGYICFEDGILMHSNNTTVADSYNPFHHDAPDDGYSRYSYNRTRRMAQVDLMAGKKVYQEDMPGYVCMLLNIPRFCNRVDEDHSLLDIRNPFHPAAPDKGYSLGEEE